jgi:frataxin-like iron-binding protein CyaY
MNSSKFVLLAISKSNLRRDFKFYKNSVKHIKDANSASTVERLNNKAKNMGASTFQVQNYERNVFNRKNETIKNIETELGQDLEKLFDVIESTNSEYLKNENHSDVKNVKVEEMSFNDFLNYSDKLINALHSGFQELKKYDENIKIEKDPRNLHLKIIVNKVGSYIIVKELETRQIAMTSPLSGLFKYKYDPVSKYWISTKDSHILDELLVREFCKHSKGLLEINI